MMKTALEYKIDSTGHRLGAKLEKGRYAALRTCAHVH